MVNTGTLHKLSAFTISPDGGNPAGVWVGETLPGRNTMQPIAAAVGFSETAFVTPSSGQRRIVRYFGPEAEMSIRQGEAMGRPSRLTVHIPASGRIVVSGTAVRR